MSPAASVAPMFGQQRLQVVVESPNKKPGHLPTPAASSQVGTRTAIGKCPERKIYGLKLIWLI